MAESSIGELHQFGTLLSHLASNPSGRVINIPNIKIVISDSLITTMSQLEDELNDKDSYIFIKTWEAVENYVQTNNIYFDHRKMAEITSVIVEIVNEPYDGPWNSSLPWQKPVTGFVTGFYLPYANNHPSKKVQINIFFDIIDNSITTALPSTTKTTTTTLPAPTKEPICKNITMRTSS